MDNQLQEIFRVTDVSYRYPNGEQALGAINITIGKGKKVALLGKNGAGKSTLMLMLNGILKPSSGRIDFDNSPISYRRKALRAIHQRVGYLFPNADDQLIAPTVYEEISFGVMNLFGDKRLARQKCEEMIDLLSLNSIADKSPHHLSSGQKKMVCLASILAMEPEVIICDEPTSHLDYQSKIVLLEQLDRLNEMGKTLVVATHDSNWAYEWTDETIILSESKVLANGITSTIMKDTELLKRADIQIPKVVSIIKQLGIDTSCIDMPKTDSELAQLIKEHYS